MRIPRDLSGSSLAKALARLGYRRISQKGSHIKLETEEGGGHRVVITTATPIPVGTLSSILGRIAGHFGISTAELLQRLKL